MVTQICLTTITAATARHTISSPSTVIEQKDVALTRKSLRDHMAVMLTDDLADDSQLFGLGEVRTDLPNNLTGLLADDCHDVCLTSIPDDVLRVESLIACIIPLVRSKYAHGVDVHPVTLSATILMDVRVTGQNVLCDLAEA